MSSKCSSSLFPTFLKYWPFNFFVNCVGIMKVRECHNADNFDKFLYSNTFLSKNTNLVTAEKVAIGFPVL